jgi:response regulator RpfG family c-di-GMP phosphodiesterase
MLTRIRSLKWNQSKRRLRKPTGPAAKGMPPREALNELVSKTGKQFDPKVVDAFKRIISETLEKV